MCKTIFKLGSLCVLYHVAVFVFEPSPFYFGILTGILVWVAYIVGSNEFVDPLWKTLFVEFQRDMKARKMINRKE